MELWWWLTAAVSILFSIATALPLLFIDQWWCRFFDFPRLQILFVLSVSLVLLLAGYPGQVTPLWGGMVALTIGSIGMQLVEIFPYMPFTHRQVRRSRQQNKDCCIKLLIYNVYMYNRKYQNFLDLASQQQPDVILMLETDHQWRDNVKQQLHKDYPYCCEIPIDNTYGMLMYSRFKLHNTQVRYLVEENIPSIKTEIELPGGDRTLFYGLHPTPPVPGENTRSTERDVELILAGKEIAEEDRPVIVGGDLNDVAWSRTSFLFQKISGLLDPRKGRGFFNSYNSRYFFMRWPLDHVFHTKHFLMNRFSLLKHIGSDHFPIMVELQFEPENKHLQKEMKADKEDMELARQKVDRVDGVQVNIDELKAHTTNNPVDQ